MSAATPPPSIPPRKRPSGATTGGSSSAPRPAGETSAGAISVPGRGGSGTTTAEATSEESTRLGWPSSSSPESEGHDQAERTTRVAPASIPPRTRTGVGPDRGASTPAAEKPADSPTSSTTSGAPAARPAGTDDDEPTPLAAAVESATSWLKKAGAATSAAISSAARPKTEEPPVTTTASAAGAAAAGAARPAATNPSSPRPQTGRIPVGQPHSGPRRVRLAISRVDPWSVMKLSFLLSVAIGLMIVIATAVVWYTLDGMHVFSKANDLITQVTGTESTVDILQYVEFRRVVSGATLVSVVNVFLMTALATIGAFLYNIVAALVGGVHVTMTDE
ncbi:DUF3566 domain-containing protein [Cellulomonas massiliensis]|uniref:DUF3566 domain-containing protein n=1 Tax=Cellulomonas massiliensis TaxID=1465811 RepID=UPI00030E4BE4|nr:DUF3566 domain-containing protein [Cellulomonas massiliensis]